MPRPLLAWGCRLPGRPRSSAMTSRGACGSAGATRASAIAVSSMSWLQAAVASATRLAQDA
eukprot:3046516-Alexandrium_andersonii.AAC.1